MKLLIERMAIKVGEDLDDGCGVGHRKDRKKRMKSQGRKRKRESENVLE